MESYPLILSWQVETMKAVMRRKLGLWRGRSRNSHVLMRRDEPQRVAMNAFCLSLDFRHALFRSIADALDQIHK